jgi:predicted flap endonuclease-1-like 5' DNA nuclease
MHSARLLKSTRYRSLAEFSRIHGIGPHTARKLYDEGCRTLEDLDRRYDAELGRTEVDSVQEGETAGIRTMLELREDLSMTFAFRLAFLCSSLTSRHLT